MDVREFVTEKLKATGFQFTRNRELILDVILSGEYSSCKEIYDEAIKWNPHIGIASVYRTVNILEDIGVISRKNMYKVNHPREERYGKTN